MCTDRCSCCCSAAAAAFVVPLHDSVCGCNRPYYPRWMGWWWWWRLPEGLSQPGTFLCKSVRTACRPMQLPTISSCCALLLCADRHHRTVPSVPYPGLHRRQLYPKQGRCIRVPLPQFLPLRHKPHGDNTRHPEPEQQARARAAGHHHLEPIFLGTAVRCGAGMASRVCSY